MALGAPSLSSLFSVYVWFLTETESHCVDWLGLVLVSQPGLELIVILLLQPPKGKGQHT